MVYADIGMTSRDFYTIVQQIAGWLVENGVKPKQRVWIKQQSFPHTELLLFGVWALGATVILADDPFKNISELVQPDFIIDQNPIPDAIKPYPDHYDPTYKAHLGDEALVFVTGKKAIRLSHYNLLVNANDVQRKLNLYDKGKFFVELQPHSTAWVVLQAIFPLYTGAPMTRKNPDLTIGTTAADYIVRYNWDKISDDNSLYFLPENTAILSVGNKGLHLTSFDLKDKKLKINGHSVMMGYTDDELNEKVFTGDSLVLQWNP